RRGRLHPLPPRHRRGPGAGLRRDRRLRRAHHPRRRARGRVHPPRAARHLPRPRDDRGARMGMIVLRRLAFAVPLLFAVSLVTFTLIAIAPGDAARVLAGPEATPAEYEELRRELGLDAPFLVQYWNWLSGALQGDLGTSIVNGQDVALALNQRLGVTLSIVIPAVVISSLLGVLIGCISAHRGGWLGRLVDLAAVVGNALPTFWIALILVTLFAVTIPLFPAIGYVGLTESPAGWAR